MPAGSEDGREANYLLDFTDKLLLTQLVKVPTRKTNILDLVFTNDDSLIHNIDQIINSSLSDHNTLVIATDLVTKREVVNDSSRDFYSTNIQKYNLIDADEEDWRRFELIMDGRDWESVSKHRVSGRISKLNRNIEQSVYEIFPLKEEKRKGNKIPRFARILMQNKRKLSDKMMRTKSATKLIELQFKLRTVEKRLADSLKMKTQVVEEKVVGQLKKNPGMFYSYAKSFSQEKAAIGLLTDSLGNITCSEGEISVILENQNESVFSSPVTSFHTEDQLLNNKSVIGDVDHFSKLPSVIDNVSGQTVEESCDSSGSLSESIMHGVPNFQTLYNNNSLEEKIEELFGYPSQNPKVPSHLSLTDVIVNE